MTSDKCFFDSDRDSANRLELWLAGMRGTDNLPITLDSQAVADIRHEMEAALQQDAAADNPPTERPMVLNQRKLYMVLYQRKLYDAVKVEIENFLGNDDAWIVDVPKAIHSLSCIRINGNLVHDYKDWQAWLFEQSDHLGYVNLLNIISRHDAFDTINPIVLALKERGAVTVINENLLSVDELSALNLDIDVEHLPLALAANISAACLVKNIIEGNLNKSHKDCEVLISSDGLRLTLTLSDKSLYIETPDHTCRQAIEIDIYDIDQIASFVA